MQSIYPIMKVETVGKYDWKKVAFALPFLAILMLWVLAAVFGITNSSLKLNFEVPEKNSANVIIGEPRPIRGDEWVRYTPHALGRMQPGWSQSNRSPLEVGNDIFSGGLARSIENAVYFEATILEKADSFNAFALLWWLPSVGTLVFGYIFFRQVGLNRLFAWLGPLMICLSGPTVWWSMSPLDMFYPAFAGAALLLFATNQFSIEGPKLRPLAMWIISSVLAAVFLVRLPFSYVPWSIPISGLIAVALLVIVAKNSNIKSFVFKVTPFTTCFVMLGTSIYLSRKSRLLSLLDTVYPGQRRTGGGANPLSLKLTWSGPYSWIEQSHIGSKLIDSNLSEISRGLTILIIPTLMMLIITARKCARDILFQASAAMSLLVIVFVAWFSFSWPSSFFIGRLLAFIPTSRMNQIVGLLVVVPFVIIWSIYSKQKRNRIDLFLFLGGLLLVAKLIYSAGVNLQQSFTPLLLSSQIWMTTIVCSLIFTAIFLLRPFVTSILIVVAMLISVLWVNPITVGPGDLIKSESARTIAKIRLDDSNGRWSSDDLFTDALIAASGSPMLSGVQTWGPNLDAWHLLDPNDSYKEIWNRGASVLVTRWDTKLANPLFESPQEDLLIVTLNPCSNILNKFQLRYVMSSRPLDAQCLWFVKKIEWTGIERWIYRREMPA